MKFDELLQNDAATRCLFCMQGQSRVFIPQLKGQLKFLVHFHPPFHGLLNTAKNEVWYSYQIATGIIPNLVRFHWQFGTDEYIVTYFSFCSAGGPDLRTFYWIISTSGKGMFYWWCLVYSRCDDTDESSYTYSMQLSREQSRSSISMTSIPSLSRHALERELH